MRALQVVEVGDCIHALEQLGRSLDSWVLADILLEHLASKGIKLGILEGIVPEASVPVVQDILNQTIVDSLGVFIHT